MKLSENRFGFIDNCEITDNIDEQNLFNAMHMVKLFNEFDMKTKSTSITCLNIENELVLDCRLTQKEVAKIAEFYHCMSKKYSENFSLQK